MIQWKVAWREMRRHPGRALLTLLSVVIGVAAVLAVGLSTGSARRAYKDMFQAVTGQAALEVAAAGNGMLDASLLTTIRQTPGVRAAVPLIQRHAIMYYHGGGRMKLIALGIDPKVDAAVRDYEVVEGQTFTQADGVLLDASLARALRIKVGDEVKLLLRRGLTRVQVQGLVQPRSGAGLVSGGALFLPLSVAQYRFAARGRLDRIQIVLAEDADLASVESELARQLPQGIEIRPPVTRSPMAEETMLALEIGLQLATAFSLLAAVFIIMNTFLMNVGQRRSQLAIMRAIGATREQISGLLFREALLLAILGTLCGTGVGLVGAKLLGAAMSRLFQKPMPPVELRALPLAIAVAFGLVVSLVGAAIPARKAAKLTPQEGLSGVAPYDIEGLSWRMIIAGVATLFASAALMAVCLAGWIPFDFSVGATVLALIGLVLILPLLLRPLTHLVELVLRPVVRVESRLARRQLLRHRGRTTLTVGVLFIAVSTGLGLANSVIDNVQDVRDWYRTEIVGDFFLRTAMPDLETGLAAAMPDAVGKEILSIEGITRIGSVRFVSAKSGEESIIVIATRNEFSAENEPTQKPSLYSAPPGDQVAVGSVLAQRLNLQVGSTIAVDTREGPRRLPITAVTNDYVAGGLTVHMNHQLAERLLGVEGVDIYVVKAAHDKLSMVESSLRDLAEKHGVLLQSYADLTGIIDRMMSGVVGSLWGLLTLGMIVATFGVVNTLGMNVLEQTRELGLLRVVAMTRGQVRKTIVAQAAMLGLLGVVPGLPAGVAMAYVMNLSTLAVVGHPVAFSLHPFLLAGGLAVSLAIVLAAAWVPAERAARLQLATALRYE